MTKNSENNSSETSFNDDIEKRRPKPFRYIQDLSELANDETLLSTSMMSSKSDDTVKKLMEQFDSIVGIGDVRAIERVILKHEKKHKKHDPSIG